MDERITGVMIYYYFVCKRKLWYFCHDIRMETENEDVMLGKILDESSLVYDVSQQENGSKRWSRIFKICKRYLTHIQNSVFEGEISKAQLAKLQQELKFCIDKELDSVIIFKSRQEKWLDKEFWGRKDDATSFIL